MYFIAFAFLALKLIAPALCTYQTCESIFCGGKLLHLVQTEHIFPSQKDFLYMRAKYPQEKILADFEELWRTRMVGRRDKREMVGKFVRENFEESQVLEGCVPEDWKRKSPLEKRMRSREAAMVVRRLHLLWPVHCRKVVSEAFTKSRQYSILPLPEPFFVASADDGEATITETYWHHKALLVSGMYRSARGVLMNLVLMVRQYKHLPKANRVYFLGRTDAPLLTPIADDYVRFTSDWDLLRNILTTLQVEFDYWIKVRTSMLQTRYHVFLAALDAKEKIPRAETYAEDWMAKVNEYGVLDENFIARRFWGRTGTDRRAIGVYLNSLMELNARLLAKYCLRFEMVGQARLYDRMSRELRKTVETLLFDTKRGRWADYDVTSGHVPGCSPGCVAPLWTGTGRGDTEGLLEGLGECVEVWRSGGGGAGPELQGLVAAGLSCCPQLRPIGLDLASSWLSSLPSPSRLPLTSAAISLYLLHLYPEVEICSLKISTPNRIITNKLLLSLCLILPFAYNFHSLY